MKPPSGDASLGRLARLAATLAERPYARRGVPMRSETVRVILADDHAMVREGLRLVLRAASDIAVIGEASSGTAVLALARRVVPDVVVLDLDMPGGDGMEVVHDLAEEVPSTRVLILTVHAEQERLLQLLEAGARGYLTKEAASNDLIEAIRVVAAGEVYVRPSAARLLAAAVVPQRASETARGRFQALSEREQTILRLVAQGYSGAEIARQLGISTKTVDAYKHRVQEKLGLEHRTDYVRFAIEAGVIGT
ncbi:MAG TPA: response regulator transcription factor [Gemmatimonadaceae bacterium]|nr:response regulator transcription factor [Gemmatimonadaceae bacterium]